MTSDQGLDQSPSKIRRPYWMTPADFCPVVVLNIFLITFVSIYWATTAFSEQIVPIHFFRVKCSGASTAFSLAPDCYCAGTPQLRINNHISIRTLALGTVEKESINERSGCHNGRSPKSEASARKKLRIGSRLVESQIRNSMGQLGSFSGCPKHDLTQRQTPHYSPSL
jgi:hypothetical protein